MHNGTPNGTSQSESESFGNNLTSFGTPLGKSHSSRSPMLGNPTFVKRLKSSNQMNNDPKINPTLCSNYIAPNIYFQKQYARTLAACYSDNVRPNHLADVQIYNSPNDILAKERAVDITIVNV